MRCLLLLAAALIAATASAEPYVFAGVGSKSSYDLGAGYAFNSALAAELAYLHAEDSGLSKSSTGDSRTSGFGLSGVVSMPIGERLSAFGRLTAYRLEVRTGALFSKTGTDTESTETTAGIGLGAAYRIADHFKVRGFYEYIGTSGELEKIERFAMQAAYDF